jgi:hypothetical protein
MLFWLAVGKVKNLILRSVNFLLCASKAAKGSLGSVPNMDLLFFFKAAERVS